MSRDELTEALLGQEVDIRFVSVAEAVSLHDGSIHRFGGTAGVRDLALLESALHKPMQQCLYENETDVCALAATLADGIAQNHAFLDGNKRTAFLCCGRFLEKNGVRFSPDTAEAVEMFRRLATHEVDAPSLSAWIRATVDDANQLPDTPASERIADRLRRA